VYVKLNFISVYLEDLGGFSNFHLKTGCLAVRELYLKDDCFMYLRSRMLTRQQNAFWAVNLFLDYMGFKLFYQIWQSFRIITYLI